MAGGKDFEEFMREQSRHAQEHFERLERDNADFREIIEEHSKVFNSMNEGVLEGVNERAAYVDAMMERSKFWSGIRDEVTRKGVIIAIFGAIAGAFFMFGFEDLAKKMLGLL